MPLPIPEILQNAASVIIAAKKALSTTSHVFESTALRDALNKIHENDLLAVLNEIGTVFFKAQNPQVQQIGTRPNPGTGALEILLKLDCGFDFRDTVVAIPAQDGKALWENLAASLRVLNKPTIIHTIGNA